MSMSRSSSISRQDSRSSSRSGSTAQTNQNSTQTQQGGSGGVSLYSGNNKNNNKTQYESMDALLKERGSRIRNASIESNLSSSDSNLSSRRDSYDSVVSSSSLLSDVSGDGDHDLLADNPSDPVRAWHEVPSLNGKMIPTKKGKDGEPSSEKSGKASGVLSRLGSWVSEKVAGARKKNEGVGGNKDGKNAGDGKVIYASSEAQQDGVAPVHAQQPPPVLPQQSPPPLPQQSPVSVQPPPALSGKSKTENPFGEDVEILSKGLTDQDLADVDDLDLKAELKSYKKTVGKIKEKTEKVTAERKKQYDEAKGKEELNALEGFLRNAIKSNLELQKHDKLPDNMRTTLRKHGAALGRLLKTLERINKGEDMSVPRPAEKKDDRKKRARKKIRPRSGSLPGIPPESPVKKAGKSASRGRSGSFSGPLPEHNPGGNESAASTTVQPDKTVNPAKQKPVTGTGDVRSGNSDPDDSGGDDRHLLSHGSDSDNE